MPDLMAVKTAGREFKQFLLDEDFWGGAYMEDASFLVNDADVAELDDKRLADTTKVTILGGLVVGHPTFSTLEDMFKAWRKRRGTEEFVVRVPLGKKASLRKLLKEIGGVLL